ncbi:MAG: hypothetical protein FWD68_18375 [Alphaproteobacteria bacterium]|nr:hypothetical protein [Alphaproteobacteria bacterium]
MIRMWRVLALLFALAGTAAVAGPPTASSFMSPAIDRNIFREGEVQRLSGDFHSWRVVCDVVTRLNQRFCSLFGAGKDREGRALVAIVVTTTDQGQPAALLRLPTNVAVGSIVEVSSVAAAEVRAHAAGKKAAKKGGAKLRLSVVSCDARNCMTLWKLSPEQIATLNSAGSLHVRYSLKGDDAGAKWGVETTSAIAVDVVVEGAGFADAVNATMGRSDLLH